MVHKHQNIHSMMAYLIQPYHRFNCFSYIFSSMNKTFSKKKWTKQIWIIELWRSRTQKIKFWLNHIISTSYLILYLLFYFPSITLIEEKRQEEQGFLYPIRKDWILRTKEKKRKENWFGERFLVTRRSHESWEKIYVEISHHSKYELSS